MGYLDTVEQIARGELADVLYSEDAVRLMFVFMPVSLDFGPVLQFFNRDVKPLAGEDDESLESVETGPELGKETKIRSFVDLKCAEMLFNELSLASFVKLRFFQLDISIQETQSIKSQLESVPEFQEWYQEVVQPLVNTGVEIRTGQVYKLSNYDIMKLVLAHFNTDSNVLAKSVDFVSKHWDLFNQWFLEHVKNHLLVNERDQLVRNYEFLFLSVFQDDHWLSLFSKDPQFNTFVTTLLACFYLCPVVHERIFIVMKQILFTLEQYVKLDEEESFVIESIEQLDKVSVNALKYLQKLIKSIEKLYQLDISIKEIVQLKDDYEKQVSSVGRLIDLSVDKDMVELYNSLCWLQSKTEFFNVITKKEVDLLVFNKLLRFKKFQVLEKLLQKLQIEELELLVLKDVEHNFELSSNFNLNSHHLQDCMKDLNLLNKTKEHTKWKSLLDSFRILTNFKISNTVIRPSDILSMSVMEIVDRIFELNENVDIFEIYELCLDLSVGLDDPIQEEIISSDVNYDFTHLSTTKNKLLVRIVLCHLKYTAAQHHQQQNYNIVIELLSNDVMSELMMTNWIVLYQYTTLPSTAVDADVWTKQETVEILTKMKRIVALMILVIPMEFTGRLSRLHSEVQMELRNRIGELPQNEPRQIDLESRLTRALASGTKEILREFL